MFKVYTPGALKYLYLDVIFLFSLLVLLPMLQDYEHHLMFKTPHPLSYLSNLPGVLYYFLTNFAICFTYYRLILKPLIFREKWIAVVISAIVFSAVLNLYTKYVVIWLALRLPFWDEEYKHLAQLRFDSFDMHINLAMAFGSNFLIMTGFAYFIKSLRQTEEMERIQREQLLSEMTYLKAQLQPHFFFNTLNNIYALAIRQSPETGPMISRLAEMMRYIIYRADATKVSLQQEIDFISNYVEIEKIRHSNDSLISLEVQGDISKQEIEPLLLLPLVENAFKHGLGDQNSSDRVHIVICIIDGELIVEVGNSRPEKDMVPLKENGLGLKNLIKRLDLLYPGRHHLNIDKDQKNYQAHLTLQLT